jgi:prepilin signal peptidase PulO-like enzyme (type II secretory pathway)
MENTPSAFKISLGYGVMLSLALIVFGLIIFLVDFEQPIVIIILSLAILIAGIVFAQINYRKKYLGDFMEYGQAFKIGFLTVLVMAIIYGIYSYIFAKYIDPGAIEEQMAKQEQMMVEQGNSEMEIEQGMKIASMFATPAMAAVVSILSNLFFGAIFSLIAAIFTKKEGQGPDYPQN